MVSSLKQDELKNINIVNFIENNPVFGIEREGNSFLIRGKSDQAWIFVSSSCEKELRLLAKRLDDKDNHFAAIEDWMVPILSEDKELAWSLSMIQFILSDNKSWGSESTSEFIGSK